jgi:hypothetical protein
MTQVWERLFVGSLADAEDLAGGNPSGITTVNHVRTMGV